MLLLWDRIDEWMMGSLTNSKERNSISATAADLELGDIKTKDGEAEQAVETSKADEDAAVARFKAALGDRVAT